MLFFRIFGDPTRIPSIPVFPEFHQHSRSRFSGFLESNLVPRFRFSSFPVFQGLTGVFRVLRFGFPVFLETQQGPRSQFSYFLESRQDPSFQFSSSPVFYGPTRVTLGSWVRVFLLLIPDPGFLVYHILLLFKNFFLPLFSAYHNTLKSRVCRNNAIHLRIYLLQKIISHLWSFDFDFSKYKNLCEKKQQTEKCFEKSSFSSILYYGIYKTRLQQQYLEFNN